MVLLISMFLEISGIFIIVYCLINLLLLLINFVTRPCILLWLMLFNSIITSIVLILVIKKFGLQVYI